MEAFTEVFRDRVNMRNILARQKPSHAHLSSENLPQSFIYFLRYQSDQGVKGEDYHKLWDNFVLKEFGLRAFVIGTHKDNGWATLVRRLPEEFEYDWPTDNTLALPKVDFFVYLDGERTPTTRPLCIVNTDKHNGDIFEARAWYVNPRVQTNEVTELIDTFLANRV